MDKKKKCTSMDEMEKFYLRVITDSTDKTKTTTTKKKARVTVARGQRSYLLWLHRKCWHLYYTNSHCSQKKKAQHGDFFYLAIALYFKHNQS